MSLTETDLPELVVDNQTHMVLPTGGGKTQEKAEGRQEASGPFGPLHVPVGSICLLCSGNGLFERTLKFSAGVIRHLARQYRPTLLGQQQGTLRRQVQHLIRS